MKSKIGHILFSEVRPFMEKIYKGIIPAIDETHLPQGFKSDQIDQVGPRLNTNSPKKFVISLFNIDPKAIRTSIILHFFHVLCDMALPLFVTALLRIIESGENFNSSSIILIVGLGLTSVLNVFFLQHGFYYSSTMAIKLRTFLGFRLADKALSEQNYNQKNDLSLLLNETEFLSGLPQTLIDSFVYGLKIIIGVSILFYLTGKAAFVAVALFLVSAPLLKWLTRKFMKLREELVAHRSQRVMTVKELISGFRHVKSFSFDTLFLEKISRYRSNEESVRQRTNVISALAGVIFSSKSILVSIILLLFFYLLGGELSASLVAGVLSVSSLLNEPFSEVSDVIHRWASIISAGEDMLPRFQAEQEENLSLGPSNNYGEISLEKFSMEDLNGRSLITNANVSFKKSERVAIIGSVGVGKTAFLKCLNGQIPFEGKLSKGASTLIEDVPFLFDSTVIDNILVGRKGSIGNLLKDLSLESDIREFSNGLESKVGPNGCFLSGGQKQRIALARALFSKREILLLDNTFSALDNKTILEISERILNDKESYPQTMVMVTQRNEVLPFFDRIFKIEEGQLVEVSKNELSSINIGKKDEQVSTASKDSSINEEFTVVNEEEYFTSKESIRGVGPKTYGSYLNNFSLGKSISGKRSWGILLVASLLAVIGPILNSWWISLVGHQWGREIIGQGLLLRLASHPSYGLVISITLTFLVLGLSAFTRVLWLKSGLSASTHLHEIGVQAIAKTSPKEVEDFGDSEVINRLHYDVDSCDADIPKNMESTIKHILYLFCIGFLFIGTTPLLIFPLFLMSIFYYRWQLFYRPAARCSKRWNAHGRKPLIRAFKEIVDGKSTIINLEIENFAKRRLIEASDITIRTSLLPQLINRFFSIRVTLLGALATPIIAVGVFWSLSQNILSVSTAAITLTYSITFWDFLNWTIRVVSELESQMTSVERLNELKKFSDENAMDTGKDFINLESGEPKFDVNNLTVQYDRSPRPVLENISSSFEGKKLYAIVGRTGSGKTTFVRALTKQIDRKSGTIKLNDVDIDALSIRLLRQSIVWAPQDTWIFNGSVAENLGVNNEEDRLEARRILLDLSLEIDLDDQICVDSDNFSSGIKQVLCIVRAIMKKPKVIILDEPTSGIDEKTEKKVFALLTKLSPKTLVIVIAHKKNTFNFCDCIFYLPEGNMEENNAKSI